MTEIWAVTNLTEDALMALNLLKNMPQKKLTRVFVDSNGMVNKELSLGKDIEIHFFEHQDALTAAIAEHVKQLPSGIVQIVWLHWRHFWADLYYSHPAIRDNMKEKVELFVYDNPFFDTTKVSHLLYAEHPEYFHAFRMLAFYDNEKAFGCNEIVLDKNNNSALEHFLKDGLLWSLHVKDGNWQLKMHYTALVLSLTFATYYEQWAFVDETIQPQKGVFEHVRFIKRQQQQDMGFAILNLLKQQR
jgi:hypothetical protein